MGAATPTDQGNRAALDKAGFEVLAWAGEHFEDAVQIGPASAVTRDRPAAPQGSPRPGDEEQRPATTTRQTGVRITQEFEHERFGQRKPPPRFTASISNRRLAHLPAHGPRRRESRQSANRQMCDVRT